MPKNMELPVRSIRERSVIRAKHSRPSDPVKVEFRFNLDEVFHTGICLR